MAQMKLTTLAFLLLELHPLFYLKKKKKISCLLCNLNTLQNILMVLGRNVEQDEMTCHIQECNSGFLTFGVISFCYI